MTVRSDEFGRIARHFSPLSAGFSGALGLRDDAALIAPEPGQELVVTTDAMVEGVHYLMGEHPERLARKLLRVNLSDLAAMGARPIAYTLTTALPASVDETWIAGLAAGLARDQESFGVHLMGGDSVSTTGPVVLSITALGTVPKGRALRRGAAVPGDLVLVSGTLGDGALGLMAARGDLAGLDRGYADVLAGRYHLPTPRTALGQRLLGLANACVDLSDGLPGDIGHICAASGVAAEIDAEQVPLSDAARAAIAANPDLSRVALAGGDDYELLFTVRPELLAEVEALATVLGLPLTRIGRIGAGSGATVRDATGKPIRDLKGWTHF